MNKTLQEKNTIIQILVMNVTHLTVNPNRRNYRNITVILYNSLHKTGLQLTVIVIID